MCCHLLACYRANLETSWYTLVTFNKMYVYLLCSVSPWAKFHSNPSCTFKSHGIRVPLCGVLFASKVPINWTFTAELVGHLVLLLKAYLTCSYAVPIEAHYLLRYITYVPFQRTRGGQQPTDTIMLRSVTFFPCYQIDSQVLTGFIVDVFCNLLKWMIWNKAVKEEAWILTSQPPKPLTSLPSSNTKRTYVWEVHPQNLLNSCDS
jgi:hypothetical protein